MNENSNFYSVLIAVLIALAVLGSCYFVTDCTIRTNNQYYNAQTQCVEHGGSFVPSSGDSGHTMCLNTK